MTQGWLRPRPFSRLKSLEYASFTAPRSRMKPSNRLGLRLHSTCGRWRRYTILRPSVRLPLSVVSALEEAEAALAVSTFDDLAEGGKLPEATETHGSSNPEALQKAAESEVNAQASHAEELAFLVQPLQTIPPADVSKGLEANLAQLSE